MKIDFRLIQCRYPLYLQGLAAPVQPQVSCDSSRRFEVVSPRRGSISPDVFASRPMPGKVARHRGFHHFFPFWGPKEPKRTPNELKKGIRIISWNQNPVSWST